MMFESFQLHCAKDSTAIMAEIKTVQGQCSGKCSVKAQEKKR